MNAIYAMAGHLIRRLNQISVSLFQERMREMDLDLTPVQFAALSVLRERSGVDQATLAGLIAYDRATMGGVIDRLENKGLVRRRINARDRRARELFITDAGLELLARVSPSVIAIQDEMLAGLTGEERATFLRLAAKAAHAGNSLSRAPLMLGEEVSAEKV